MKYMSKYDMMMAAQDLDLLDSILYDYLVEGKIKYENGYLVGKTYEVKNTIKNQYGMAGKWDPAVKGWKVEQENFDREFESLKARFDI